MIWLNLTKLENKISNNELTEKEGVNYVIAYLICISSLSKFASNNENIWFKLSFSVLVILFTIWGVTSSYKINNEIDGKDFLKRLFAIGWIINLRIALASFIVAIFVGVSVGIFQAFSGITLIKDKDNKEVYYLLIIALLYITYYKMIINSFRRLKPITE